MFYCIFVHSCTVLSLLRLGPKLPRWAKVTPCYGNHPYRRVAVRQDTCALSALSLNIRQRLHPVIWSIASLPHDCLKLVAVPKPIGGVLLFAANSLTYMTQSVPPYGVSLNSMGDKNTNFPLSESIVIVLFFILSYLIILSMV